jgi:hypothetical protein
MKKIHVTIGLLFFYIISVYTQVAPGQWRDHLPYMMAKQVVDAGNKVYCITSNSMFYYNKSDNSVNKLSKIQGLSECLFSTIGYSEENDMLIIAYSSSNIDILNKNKIINLPGIKNKYSITDKRINSIFTYKNHAFLSCNFGIVVLNLEKIEISDTYYPCSDGTPVRVNDVCTDGTFIYAATQTGIYQASISDPFLVNYNRWTRKTNMISYNKEFTNIEFLGNRLYSLSASDSLLHYEENGVWNSIAPLGDNTIHSISVSNNTLLAVGKTKIYTINNLGNIVNNIENYSPRQAIVDKSGAIWAANYYLGLEKNNSDGSQQQYIPNGPIWPSAFCVRSLNGSTWVTAGTRTSNWNFSSNSQGAYFFNNNSWSSFLSWGGYDGHYIADLINVKIDPYNSSHVFMAAWGWSRNGLIEINNGNIKIFTPENSSLQYFVMGNDSICRTYGLDYDSDGNLWVTNTGVAKPISVLKKDGKWKSFSFDGSLAKYSATGYFGHILCTSWGDKWCITRNPNGIFIFNDNNTIDNESDDQYKFITIGNLEGAATSSELNGLVEDKDGSIWVASNAGPLVFSDPQNYLNDGFSPHKILVPFNDGTTSAGYLLEKEKINAISIDGANRKWIATANSGAFLVSDDGTKLINNFKEDNSPMLSNNVYDISVDNKTGEVFFATENGIISYHGYATEGGDDYGNVYAYPNPVSEKYNGDIIITGLVTDANVKITDISGNLVYQTNALGGRASWNGKNFDGKRVHTGVYLIFCSNDDGTKTHVTKLLFIH